MPRRKTSRFQLPKFNLFGVKLPKAKAPQMPKANAPKVRLPQVDLPKIPKITLPVRQILVVGVMAILVMTMMNLNTRLMDFYRLSGQRDTLKGQIHVLESTKAALQTQVAFVQSDKAVEEFARNSHLVREGEKLVVVLTPEDNVLATPASSTSAEKTVENWDVWWTLFFGN